MDDQLGVEVVLLERLDYRGLHVPEDLFVKGVGDEKSDHQGDGRMHQPLTELVQMLDQAHARELGLVFALGQYGAGTVYQVNHGGPQCGYLRRMDRSGRTR